MENIAEFLKEQLKDYECKLANGQVLPVQVYPGFIPIRKNSDPIPAFVYVLVTSSDDVAEQGTLSQAQVEIGISVEDDDHKEGWRSLYNLVEHIRIALLKNRTIANKHRIILPLKFELSGERLYPQWQGVFNVSYTIGQPIEEGIDYGD